MAKAEWFGPRLKELREAKSLTQQGLADAAELTHSAIRSWERGVNSPNWWMVLALCKALEVTPDAFIVKPAGLAGKAPPEKRKRGRPPKVEPLGNDPAKPRRGRPSGDGA